MTSELDNVRRALESVEREIHELESSLSDARRRKTDLLNQKATLERRPEGPPQNGWKDATPSGETPEELQARIAELQRQIQEAEQQNKTKAVNARSRSPVGRKLDQGGRGGGLTKSPQGNSRRQVGRAASPRAPATATREASAQSEKKTSGWNLFGRGKKDTDQNEIAGVETTPAPVRNNAESSSPKENVAPPPESAPNPPPAQSREQPATASIVIGSRASADWDRPGWAHAMDKQDSRAVNNDPIANPLLQHAEGSGYRRQVFAKDIDLDKGTFVKPQAKAPDPRLTWIVLRLNGKGIPGKIVMHLHGKDVNGLVDHFIALKDNNVMVGGPNRASLTVQCQPPLFITTMAARGLDSQTGVYGVVQEGHEVLDQVLNAGGDAEISIKQAHIFPVKKSKGGI